MVLELTPDDDADDEDDEDLADCGELSAVQGLAGFLELQCELVVVDGHVLWRRGFGGFRLLEKLFCILCI